MSGDAAMIGEDVPFHSIPDTAAFWDSRGRELGTAILAATTRDQSWEWRHKSDGSGVWRTWRPHRAENYWAVHALPITRAEAHAIMEGHAIPAEIQLREGF